MRETEEGKVHKVPIEEEETKIETEESNEELEQAADDTEREQSSEQELIIMQQEVQEANDMMLRLAAELENYKKRSVKDRESIVKYASQSTIESLLPILDNFERAIESVEESKNFDSLLDGVKMISKQVFDLLEKKGVSEIESVGEAFDPNIHEAVMQAPSCEYPENVVSEELQKGYMLHDRVIRPSMVVVSSGSEEE